MLICATNQIGDAEPQKYDEYWISFLFGKDCRIIATEIHNAPLETGLDSNAILYS